MSRIRFLFFVVLLHFLTSTSALAQNLCSEILFTPQNEATFADLQNSNIGQKILLSMPTIPEKVLMRYWSHADVNEMTLQLLKNIDGASNSFRIENLGWMLTKTLKLEDHLFLDLIHIQVKNNGQSIQVGKRSAGASSLFLKAIVSFMKASFLLKTKHPELRTIVIRGVNIKNPMLMSFLAENGFQRNDLHSNTREMEKLIHFDLNKN